MNLHKTLARRSQRGFSIIEALIAGLVLSFGTLALVGVQVALTRNGDVARQRTEATRLAQDRMEQLRAFASATTVTGVSSYEGMAANSSETIQNNTTPNATLANVVFTRTSDVGGTGTDLSRPVSVAVTWTDRSGGLQEVRLSSVIARANHFKVGLIMANVGSHGYPGFVQQRHPVVPIRAVGIGNGRSAYRWPNTTTWYVFNNSTAEVQYNCANPPTSSTNLAADCTQILAYVLAGYVSSAQSNQNSANIDTMLSPWLIDACSFVNTSNVQGTPSCFVENAVASSAINPDCPYIDSNITPTSSQLDDLKFYKCYAALIEVPLGSGSGYTGKLEFAAAPTGNRKVCRFNNQGLMNSSGVYNGVDESMNNENYFARMSGNCVSPQAQHQP